MSWLRDGILTQGREAITKGKTHSQFLISSSQRSDAGVYRAHLKNDYGEAHYDISVRVTGGEGGGGIREAILHRSLDPLGNATVVVCLPLQEQFVYFL